jgi:hypothetical protein
MELTVNHFATPQQHVLVMAPVTINLVRAIVALPLLDRTAHLVLPIFTDPLAATLAMLQLHAMAMEHVIPQRELVYAALSGQAVRAVFAHQITMAPLALIIVMLQRHATEMESAIKREIASAIRHLMVQAALCVLLICMDLLAANLALLPLHAMVMEHVMSQQELVFVAQPGRAVLRAMFVHRITTAPLALRTVMLQPHVTAMGCATIKQVLASATQRLMVLVVQYALPICMDLLAANLALLLQHAVVMEPVILLLEPACVAPLTMAQLVTFVHRITMALLAQHIAMHQHAMGMECATIKQAAANVTRHLMVQPAQYVPPICTGPLAANSAMLVLRATGMELVILLPELACAALITMAQLVGFAHRVTMAPLALHIVTQQLAMVMGCATVKLVHANVNHNLPVSTAIHALLVFQDLLAAKLPPQQSLQQLRPLQQRPVPQLVQQLIQRPQLLQQLLRQPQLKPQQLQRQTLLQPLQLQQQLLQQQIPQRLMLLQQMPQRPMLPQPLQLQQQVLLQHMGQQQPMRLQLMLQQQPPQQPMLQMLQQLRQQLMLQPHQQLVLLLLLQQQQIRVQLPPQLMAQQQVPRLRL